MPESMRQRLERAENERLAPWAARAAGITRRYRIEDAGVLVEASGALPDGTLVDGPQGLRRVLLDRRLEFVETLAEKLLTYALGRGLETYDRPAVREIRRRVESEDYRFSALVLEIARSLPFQRRREEQPS